MMFIGPVQSEIPSSHVTDKIRWLEIHQGDGGFYLYQLIDKNLPPIWDTFYQNMDDLINDCISIWGVLDNMWHPIHSTDSSAHRGLI
jgi:hypothetical protein